MRAYNPQCSELGHSADIEEIEDLENFLQKVIPPEGGGGGL